MYLNLVSDDKRSAVSFDFTKFFSEKGYYVGDGKKKKSFVKRDSSHYKQLMKNLVDKYINFDLVDRLKKSPVDILDSWFREALEEELTAPQKEFLQKNHDTFRKMYKLSEETKDNKSDNKVKIYVLIAAIILMVGIIVTLFLLIKNRKSRGEDE